MEGILCSKTEFCRRAGITPETLRHYLDLGLIKPAKVEANGYRIFDMENLLNVWSCRLGLALGSSLKQLPRLWDESAQEGFLRFLDQRKANLETQIQELNRQRQMVEEIHRYVAAEQEGGQRISEEPVYQGWSVFSSGNDCPAAQVAAFVAALPFSHVQINYPVPAAGQSLAKPEIGLGIFEDRWDKLGLADKTGLQPMQAGTALCWTLFTSRPLELTRDDVAPLLEEMRRRQCTAHSPMMCTPYYHEIDPDGTIRYLLKCRILVRPLK